MEIFFNIFLILIMQRYLDPDPEAIENNSNTDPDSKCFSEVNMFTGN